MRCQKWNGMNNVNWEKRERKREKELSQSESPSSVPSPSECEIIICSFLAPPSRSPRVIFETLGCGMYLRSSREALWLAGNAFTDSKAGIEFWLAGDNINLDCGGLSFSPFLFSHCLSSHYFISLSLFLFFLFLHCLSSHYFYFITFTLSRFPSPFYIVADRITLPSKHHCPIYFRIVIDFSILAFDFWNFE